ncbi:MFS transporter [Kitasatospora indigofera]|uniref:MFS transporter n=1 Tax=Kitasatospora indigofera TaxID=67307 RepID=UPI003247BD8F
MPQTETGQQDSLRKPPAALPSPDVARLRRRAVTATVVGNFVESFDWLAYGLFAPLFAERFFPSADPTTSLLGAFAVLGVGVLARPLGGILLGRLADRHGRKPALLLAITLMTAGSVLIGSTPTYQRIGMLAPVLLLGARLAQGISSGGEWPAAAAYLMELAPRHRRGLYGSLFSLTTAAGAFTAAMLGGALTGLVGSEAMEAWGWRVPFLIGGMLGLVLLALRSRITESEVFQREVSSRPTRSSLWEVLSTHRRQVLRSILLVAGMATVGSTWTSVIPAMGQRLAPAGTMFWVVVCATAVMILLQVPIGLLVDRVGGRRFLVLASLLFATGGSWAYLAMNGRFTSLLLAYGSGVVYLVCVTTVLPMLLAEIFPPQVRALGIGLPYALTSAVLGGATPLLATYLGKNGPSGWFIAAVVVAVLLGIPATAASPARRPWASRSRPAPSAPDRTAVSEGR